MAKRKKQVIKRANHEERIMKRKQSVATYFIVFLMVASLGGFALSSNHANKGSSLKYGPYQFVAITQQHPLASTYTINAFQETKSGMIFYSSPRQAEQVSIIGNLTAMLKNKAYYYYLFKPDTRIDSLHDWLRFDLTSNTNKVLLPAVTRASEAYPQAPILSCLNATVQMPVIQILEGNKTTINVTSNGCVKITMPPQDVLLVRDRLLYSLTGIIDK